MGKRCPLLSSGDEDDRDLAKFLDAQGYVPGSMVIRGLTGEVEAYGVVDFWNWVDNNVRAIVGQ